MAWNGSGKYVRTNGVNTGAKTWQKDKAGSVKITAARHDTHDQDIATGITACLAKNGENSMTGDFDMGGNDIINVGSGGVTIVPPSYGTFLPTIYGSSTAGTYNYSQQEGSYTIIGDDVWVDIDIQGTWSSDPSGDIRISIPHNIATGKRAIITNVLHVNLDADSNLFALAVSTQAYLTLNSYTTNGNYSTVTFADQVSNLHELNIQGKYIKA